MLSTEELQVIKERCEKATPGKWTIAGRPPCVVDRPLGDDKKVVVYGMDSNIEGQTDNWDDLSFIANARQDIPKLLAEIETLKRMLDNLEMTVWDVSDYYLADRIVNEYKERLKGEGILDD